MSEEEKKAIEMLKDRQKDLLEGSKSSFYSSDRELYKEHAEAIDTISNLIEKLQKERDIYYYEWKTLEADLINNDIIPKDKIRKLDNECFPRYKVGLFKGQRIMGTNECTYFAEKMLELLEEE